MVNVDHELQLVIDRGVNGEIARPTPASFAAGMLRMINNLEDPQWKANASRRSIELASQWSIQSQADEMLRLYQEVAQLRQSSAG